MKNTFKYLALGLSLSALAAFAHGAKWAIDGAHSNLNFNIRHLGIANVTGSFGSFNGSIQFDAEKPEEGMVEATIQIASINTNNADRDAHLNNEDYFNSPKFPVATFKSTQWKKTGDNQFEVTGDLTLMGMTKSVSMDVELLGVGQMRGKTKSGWTATTTLDRYEWGIGGEGNLPLGRKVDLTINVEANKM